MNTLKIDIQHAAQVLVHFLAVGGVKGLPHGRMAGTIEHALRRQFNKGDRVYATEFAFEQGIVKQPLTYGTVVATPRRIPMVSVLVDGRKSPGRFHAKFWERVVE